MRLPSGVCTAVLCVGFVWVGVGAKEGEPSGAGKAARGETKAAEAKPATDTVVKAAEAAEKTEGEKAAATKAAPAVKAKEESKSAKEREQGKSPAGKDEGAAAAEVSEKASRAAEAQKAKKEEPAAKKATKAKKDTSAAKKHTGGERKSDAKHQAKTGSKSRQTQTSQTTGKQKTAAAERAKASTKVDKGMKSRMAPKQDTDAAENTAENSGPHIRVARAVVCSAVVDHEPVGIGTSFVKAKRTLCCFSHIEGAPDTSQIVHTWYYKGAKVGLTQLSVRSPSWRTYSRKEVREDQVGAWKVEVVEKETGELLGTVEFTIQ